jgi:branched-chain amino acid transport system substrate-binding protein
MDLLRRNTRSNRLRLGSGVLALALLAAACGDDKGATTVDSSPAGDTTTTTVAAEVTTTTAAEVTAAPTTAAPTTAAPTTAAPTVTTKAPAGAVTTKATTTKATTTTVAPTTVATTTASTAPPKPTKSEIVIGTLLQLNGSTATVHKPTVDVANAWVAWVNAEKGGINGHPVRVVFKDSKNNATDAAAAARELVEQDKIIAAVGSSDTAPELAWTKVFVDAKVPVIGGNASADAAWHASTSVGLFPLNQTQAAGTTANFGVAKANGASKFGAILCLESPACAAADPIYKGLAESIGIPYVGSVLVANSDPNYTAACLSLKNAGADWVNLGVAIFVAEKVIKDCAAQGFKPSWGASSATLDPAIVEPLSKTAGSFSGFMQGFPYFLNNAAVKNFLAVTAKYSPGKEVRNPQQTVAWSAFEMFRKAMANASDNPTAAEVMTAMNNVKNEDLDGLLVEKMSFTAGQVPNKYNCLWLTKLVNGSWSVVTQCYPT